jgi:hypothetical protein
VEKSASPTEFNEEKIAEMQELLKDYEETTIPNTLSPDKSIRIDEIC